MMNVLRKIASAIMSFLWRLSIKYKLVNFKRAIKLQLDLGVQLRLLLRHRIPSALLPGHDKKLDQNISAAGSFLLFPELFEPTRPFEYISLNKAETVKIYESIRMDYANHKDEADLLLLGIENDEGIQSVRKNYFLIRHYIACAFDVKSRDQEANYFIQKAKEIDEMAMPLDDGQLYAMRASTKKEISKLRNEINARRALKISLSLEKAAPIIAAISSLFLISGYLYNRYYLGSFGIDVSKFFTVSDYLASSIESIRYSFYATAFGLLGLWEGLDERFKRPPAPPSLSGTQKSYLGILVFLFFVSIALLTREYLPQIFYYACLPSAIIALCYISEHISDSSFKEPLVAYVAILVVGYFAVHMVAVVLTNIYIAKNESFELMQKHRIEFVAPYPISGDDVALIAANSNYFFFIDRERVAHIVPKAQVVYISVIE